MNEYIPALLEKDETFRLILEQYGVPGFPSRPEGFESMCKTILEQQVSLTSARASYHKLNDSIQSFTPEHIVKFSDEEFRACGISRQKTTYLKALAEAVLDGLIDFKSFSQKTPDAVRQELIQVKGIGNWTIDVYLMFSLRSPDILPLGDIGIVSAIKDLYGFETMEQIIKYTGKWAPYRTAAAFFLWHYYLEKRGRKFPN